MTSLTRSDGSALVPQAAKGEFSPVIKFSWSRNSTVRRSMAAGTKSKPVLEQRMASDGDKLWHMQRFGHGCPLHAAASNSRENHSRSIVPR